MAAADLRRSGAVAIPGEKAGSVAWVSPMAGYLEKVQERAASLDCCPWCASKSLHSPLRSYRLSLHESIALCTEPQCLFPLVSRPLEDVLASLVPAAGGRKRKTLENKDDCEEVRAKRVRFDQLHTYAQSTVANGHGEAAVALVERRNGISRPPQDRQTAAGTPTGQEKPPSPFSVIAPRTDEDGQRLGRAYNEQVVACHQLRIAAEGPVAATKEAVASPEEPVDSPAQCADWFRASIDVAEETVGSWDESIHECDEAVGGGLFWKNAHNLCWLDVLLVVLVNCGSLRRRRPPHEPPRAAVWRLMSGYDALRAGAGEARVRRDTGERLRNLRTAVFELLRPQLRCKLGTKESPVFAMPLLLAADSWAEPLFHTTYCWELECAECKTVTRERVTKTLPTFTNVVPDWHPLRAAHWAPCNACGARHQRRSMKLERVAPVLALHFAEGVPHGDVGALAFTLEGRRHAVTALVQYDRHAQHFVAWTRTPDGSWREFDDLKHPQSVLHPTLPVPAQEMHLLFWEAQETSPGCGACSPSSARPDSPPPRSVARDRHFLADDQNVSTEGDCGDVSIGSVTLLDAFRGLSRDDIITLTLTEVGADAPTDHEALLGCIPAPDSSSPTAEDPGEAPAHSAESNDKNPDDDPASQKAPGRTKRISKAKRQTAGKTVQMKWPPQEAAAQASDPPHQSVQRASPVSSTGPPEPKSRWSFLLSQHLANQRPSMPPPAPVTHVVPRHPRSHSTPAPEPPPMEDGNDHPLKAAEAFGAFGASVQSPPPLSKSQIHAGSPRPPAALSDTEALRYKLLKKLKAKKKKLAKLNQLLAQRPDIAAPNSSGGFLPSDLPLPSPAVSPDSSGFLDVLACGQDAAPDNSQTDNFLDELLSMTPAATAAQRAMEDDALRELELLLS